MAGELSDSLFLASKNVFDDFSLELLKSRSWQTNDERNNVLTKIVRLTIETNVASGA